MTTKRKPKLQVVMAAGQHFIEVSSKAAQKLHSFLREKHVLAEPPVPAFTGVDVIQLGRGMNPVTVQKLLNEWQ